MIFRRITSWFNRSFRAGRHQTVSTPVTRKSNVPNAASISASVQLVVPPAAPSAATLKSPIAAIDVPVVEEPVNQDKRFKKAVITEMMVFRQNVETLATSEAGIADGWLKRIGLGGFSAAITVLNTGVGLLAAFGLLLAPVSAGIALGISLVGIIGAIGLNIYLNYKDRDVYKRADKFMERDNIEDDMSKIADALAVVLRDKLSNCTRNEADMLAKASCAVISKVILNRKIASFELLQSPETLKVILSKYASYAPEHKFQAASMGHKKQGTRDILRGLVKVEPVVAATVIKRSVKDVSSTVEEREPLLATVSGQSMFAKANVEQSRRFAPVPPVTPSPRRMAL